MSTERTAEDWGRVAVGLPGWRWMPGMLQRRNTGPCQGSRRSVDSDYYDTGHEARVMAGDTWPDPDDPATEGCLMRRLGSPRSARQALRQAGHHDAAHRLHIAFMLGKDVGRACIATAEALGRWPGGSNA